VLDKSDQVPDWDKVYGSHTFHEITNFWPTRFLRTRRYKYHRNVAWKLDFPFATDLYASLTWEGIRNSGTPGKQAMIGPRTLKNYIRRPPEELYDLDNDPHEIENLASHPDHQGTIKELRAELETWQMETKDPFLWRDGQSVLLMKPYVKGEGMRVPDKWDVDVDNPGNTAEDLEHKGIGVLGFD
jgi:N-sulfoglucosamine sulfohydrolase